MTVDRASFDDLVTLVTQAPTWEKDRVQGVRTLLRALGDEKADAPEQILARWTWRLARATRKVQDRRASARVPGGQAAARRARELARPPARGERGEARQRRARPAARGRRGAARLGRGLHAAREPADRRGARAARHDPGGRERARRQPAGAEGRCAAARAAGGASARRRARRRAQRPGSRAAAQQRRRSRRPKAQPERRNRSGRRGVTPACRPETAPIAHGRALPDPAPDRLPRGDRHGGLAVRPSRAADRVRRRRERRRAAALRDHRRARHELRRLHAVRHLAARPARAAAGPAAQPLDRAAVPRRGDADLPAARRAGSSGRSRASAAAARRRPRRRLPARREPRARLRALRRADLGAISANAARVHLGLADGRAHARLRARRRRCRCSRSRSLGQRATRRDPDERPGAADAASASCWPLAALALVFNVDTKLQTWFPDYTHALQGAERSSVARDELAKLAAPRALALQGADGRGQADRLRPRARLRRASRTGSTRSR